MKLDSSKQDISVKLMQALDLSKDFAALISSRAKILWLNKTLADRLGSTQSALTGLKFSDLLDPALADLADEVLFTTINEGEFRGELLISGEDGSFPAYVSTSYIPPDSSETDFMVLILASDRTREKMMEDEIRKRREFLNAIISKSPIGIFCFDKDKKITVINNALITFLNKTGIRINIDDNLACRARKAIQG